MFVNGAAQSVGYMGQLRIDPRIGKGMYLARALGQGFRFYHDLHADGRASYYLMSIIEDNIAARRLLTCGLSGYPHAREYARLFTYAIYPKHRKRHSAPPDPLRLVRGSDAYAEQIVACLNRNGMRKQFASHWTPATLFTANLKPADFFVVLDGETVVGCLACWDQNSFKQTVVRGYSGMMGYWRKVLNLLSPIGGWPYLPELNTTLRHSYASHLAVDGDDPAVFAALLRALYNHSFEQRFSYFMIGLAEANPLRKVVELYRPLTYVSQLYLVAWEDGEPAAASVDAGLIPAVEIAIL
jgi:hypothetical protein